MKGECMTQIYSKHHILAENVEKAITFNQNIIWPYNDEYLALATTKEELEEIFRLRSRIYTNMGYQKEFPDPVQGYNFDNYDKHAAIFYTHKNGVVTGTCRIIFDTMGHLPIDDNYSLGYLRQKTKHLAELSRFIIDSDVSGLSPEFKLLIKGMYGVIVSNPIELAVSVIAKEHFKLYDRVGGFKKEALLPTYGTLQNPYMITTWDTTQISPFFKRAFLHQKEM